jgi:hypothetical protein
MCCNFSHEKALKEEETVLQDGTIDTSDVSSFCAVISCSLVRRSLLTYLSGGLRTGPSLIDLYFWTVSR